MIIYWLVERLGEVCVVQQLRVVGPSLSVEILQTPHTSHHTISAWLTLICSLALGFTFPQLIRRNVFPEIFLPV